MLIQKLLSEKKYRARVSEVVAILSKYGLASWLDDTKIEVLVRSLKDAEGSQLSDFSLAEKLRKACEDLGSAFIKLGQILSTRPDLLGDDITFELSKLQDSTPTDNESYIRETIQFELGKPAEELFAKFNFTPIASASIGQVHEAISLNGERLAVKLLHQDIESKIKVDLDILIGLSELAENHISALKQMRFSNQIKDFGRTLKKELSLTREASNISTFQNNFKRNSAVVFPFVYTQYSSQRVLTMRFEEGESLKTASLNLPMNTRQKLAEEGAEMYLNMIFRDNFFHGDPHPGNILVNAEGKLVLLDFGMIGSLNSAVSSEIEDFLIALVNQDSESATESIYAICEVSPEVEKSELVNEIDYWIREYINQNVGDINTVEAMSDLNTLIHKFQIVMPGNMALLLKVLVQLDGTTRLLDADFNVMAALKAFYVKLYRYRYNPENVLKKAFTQTREWKRVLRILPKALSKNLSGLNNGGLQINLQHKGLEKSVNRLVLGIIAASLFLGSVILWSLKVPPLVLNSSLFGMVGYIFSVVLMLKLIRDIFKPRKF